MHGKDFELVQWANSRLRSKVTLGQLVALLELYGSESVAAINQSSVSQAVNYRQKLNRLETALEMGPLTKRVGTATQLNDKGQRVVGEVRLLLRELCAIGSRTAVPRAWIVGAGDAWLQSVLVPVLAKMAKSSPHDRWEVCNLRVIEVCQALREGRVHFGFIRKADIRTDDCLEIVRVYRGPTYSILAGNAADAPTSAPLLIEWLRKRKQPFVQQGSTWASLREKIDNRLGSGLNLTSIEISVVCETHPQAAVAAAHGDSWCIVPTNIANMMADRRSRCAEIARTDSGEDMALVTYSRSTEKLPGAGTAQETLKKEIGAALREALA